MNIIIECREIAGYLDTHGVPGISFEYVDRTSLRVRKQLGSKIEIGKFTLPTEIRVPLTVTVEQVVGSDIALRYDSCTLINWLLKLCVRYLGGKVEEYADFHSPRSVILHLGAIPKLKSMLAAVRLEEIWFEKGPSIHILGALK